jgi:hypothetical protein
MKMMCGGRAADAIERNKIQLIKPIFIREEEKKRVVY